jgi:TRAP-type C4-dicarboxylate transport system permease small subunit
MKSMWSVLDNTQSIMKAIAAFCLMGMCLMTCADVFLRSTLNRPIFGSEEIVSIFAVLTIGFALPYSHKKDSHVGVEILVRLLSKKTQHVIKFLTNILSFTIFALLTWKMFVYAQTMGKSGEVSMNLELPMYYFIYALSFCLMVLSVCILHDVLKFFIGVEKKA